MDPAEIIRIKELLPTSLGSDEVREQIAADILRRSIFSARMEDLSPPTSCAGPSSPPAWRTCGTSP